MSIRLGNGNWAVSSSKLLAYNDAAGPFFNKEFDFTRATSATRINKSGLIELVDNNIARIDFTGSSDGHLLIEKESTNLITFSEDLEVSSGGTSRQNNATTTASSLPSPDGGTNAFTFVYDGTFNASIKKQIAVSADEVITFSVFIKKTEETNFSGDSKCQIGIFNNVVSTETTPLGNALNAATIGEWVRYSVTATADSDGGNVVPNIRCDEAAQFDVFGWQLENNSFATSYIPTSGSTVTRNTETCLDSGTSQDFNSLEGVLYCEIAGLADGHINRNIAISDGTTSNTAEVFLQAAEGNIKFRLKASGTADVQGTIPANDQLAFNKCAFKYKSGESSFFINGVKVREDTDTFNLSGSLSELNFSAGNSATNLFEGKVREVRVYTKALTEAELITLTT